MATPKKQDGPKGNDRFLIADFTIGADRKQVFLLNPGDWFEGFGGSSHGLVVRKTASLITRETGPMGQYDVEHDIASKTAWDAIFNAVHAARLAAPKGE